MRTFHLPLWIVAVAVGGCSGLEVDLSGRACDGGACVEGYACHPFDDICVKAIEVGCNGAVCPSRTSEGDSCGSPGSFVPCVDGVAADDCSNGCRTCGDNGRWGPCATADCTPDCAGRCAGDDGCGGTCSEPCFGYDTCGGGGQKGVCGCAPQCAGRCAGSDQCGGTCSEPCVAPAVCGGDGSLPNSCAVAGCTATCTGVCGGDNGCSGSCPDNCAFPETCGGGGTNVCGCVPSCGGKCSGPDGCGGTCSGACVFPETCGAVTPGECGCVPTCAPGACGGDDGCGGACPDTCVAPDTCGAVTPNECGCAPTCSDCSGGDGCGGTCACGGGETCGAGGPGICGPSWMCGYLELTEITVSTSSAPIGAGYSLLVEIDHAYAVSLGDSRADGDDIRVVYYDGSTFQEIDRVLDPETSWNSSLAGIWFATQAPIPASSTNTAYFLLNGDLTPGAPPEDEGAVFHFADFFDRPGSPVGNGWTMPVSAGNAGIGLSSGAMAFTNDGSLYSPRAQHAFAALSGLAQLRTRMTWNQPWNMTQGFDPTYWVQVHLGDAAALETPPTTLLGTAGIGPDIGLFGDTRAEWTWLHRRFVGHHQLDTISSSFEIFAGSVRIDALIDPGSETFDLDVNLAGAATSLPFASSTAKLDTLRIMPGSTNLGGTSEFDYFILRDVVDPEPAVDVGSVFTVSCP